MNQYTESLQTTLDRESAENPLVTPMSFYSLVGTITWLVMSEGIGDGGLECMLASWETKPESWEETLLSRWAPAEGICRRLSGGGMSVHIQHLGIFWQHLSD